MEVDCPLSDGRETALPQLRVPMRDFEKPRGLSVPFAKGGR